MKKKYKVKVYNIDGTIDKYNKDINSIPLNDNVIKIIVEEKSYYKNHLVKNKRSYYYKGINLDKIERI